MASGKDVPRELDELHRSLRNHGLEILAFQCDLAVACESLQGEVVCSSEISMFDKVSRLAWKMYSVS